MPIKLNTASGGGVTLSAANTATDKTITVPADDGTMIYANSSGNVGIGTSSPSQKLHVVGKVLATDNLEFSTADTAIVFQSGAGRFFAGGSERARIDSSGRLIIGTTTTVGPSKLFSYFSGSVDYGLGLQDSTTTSGTGFIGFFNSAGTAIGNIVRNGTTNAVLYNTTSDYRLKDEITPLTGALGRVLALKPVKWVWKDCDGASGEGFIAHEVQEVVPSAVNGEKDAVNEDGSIKPQGMDASYLVATLTAAIQEQQQMIETLQAKVAALEAQ